MDSTLEKKIHTEQKFATAVYKNFMSLRYGMEPCCIVDMEAAVIDKELCDWQDLKSKNKMGLRKRNIQQCETASEKDAVIWSSVDVEALIKRLDILETTTLEDEKDLSFVYEQPVGSLKWIVNHNLGKKPSVRLEDLAGSDLMAEVDYIDNNTLEIKFAIPVAGTAFLN